jgi:hypothetical protein
VKRNPSNSRGLDDGFRKGSTHPTRLARYFVSNFV